MSYSLFTLCLEIKLDLKWKNVGHLDTEVCRCWFLVASFRDTMAKLYSVQDWLFKTSLFVQVNLTTQICFVGFGVAYLVCSQSQTGQMEMIVDKIYVFSVVL